MNGRKRAAVLLMTSVLGVAACGESDEGSGERVEADATLTPAARVLAARTATTAAKSAALEMTIEVSAQGQTATIRADGATDFESGDMTMLMDMGELMGGIGADRYLEVRTVDDVVYMRLPKAARDAAQLTTEWVSLDVAAAGALNGVENSDPMQYLEALAAVSDGVTETGTESIDGVATTRYDGVIDFSLALDEMDPEVRARLAEVDLDFDAMAEQIRAAGADKMPFAAYVDADGLLRKLVITVGGTAVATPDGSGLPADVSTRVTVLYRDFGTPVDVEAPPPDQVGDYSQLVGALGQ